MDLAAWLVFGVLSGGLLIAAWVQADRVTERSRHRVLWTVEPRVPTSLDWASDDPDEAATTTPSGATPESTVLAGPPLVQDNDTHSATTLRDWLIHFHPDRHNAWAEVAREFCDAMAGHPHLAGYFAGSGRDALQKHFLGALILITGDGISVGALDRIRHHHARVHDIHGRGITPRAYDTAMRILVDLLRSRNIPDDALGQLMIILYLAGQVVVTAPDDPRGRVAGSG